MVFDVLVISLQASPWKVQVIIADCSVWKALVSNLLHFWLKDIETGYVSEN
jgi:hypothetical protein